MGNMSNLAVNNSNVYAICSVCETKVLFPFLPIAKNIGIYSNTKGTNEITLNQKKT